MVVYFGLDGFCLYIPFKSHVIRSSEPTLFPRSNDRADRWLLLNDRADRWLYDAPLLKSSTRKLIIDDTEASKVFYRIL